LWQAREVRVFVERYFHGKYFRNELSSRNRFSQCDMHSDDIVTLERPDPSILDLDRV
jgi:hypothetical protein